MAALVLVIPEEVTDALRFPASEIEQELRKELALVLYQREALSSGTARKLSGMTRGEFDHLLGQRRVTRHYTSHDLQDDLQYADSGQ